MQSQIDLTAEQITRVKLGESTNLNIPINRQAFNAIPPPKNHSNNNNVIVPQVEPLYHVNAVTNSMTGSQTLAGLTGSNGHLSMPISKTSQVNFILRNPVSSNRQMNQIEEENNQNNNMMQNQQPTQPFKQNAVINGGIGKTLARSNSSQSNSSSISNGESSDIRTTTNIKLGVDEPIYATVSRNPSTASRKVDNEPSRKLDNEQQQLAAKQITEKINRIEYDDISGYAEIPSSPVPPPAPPAPPMPTNTTEDVPDNITTNVTAKQVRIQSEPQQIVLPPKSDSDADTESATWQSLDDSRSEMSDSTNGSANCSGSSPQSSVVEEDSAFSMAETEDDARVDELIHTRTAMHSSNNTALMVQVSFDSENTAKSKQFQQLLIDITTSCNNYFRRKESNTLSLNRTQLLQLPLPDRTKVSERLQSVNEDLKEHINVVGAAGRRGQEKQYIGSQVTAPEHTYQDCSIGKHGVIVSLKQKSKFSPAEEFSKQLCEHITSLKPQSLGEFKIRNAKEKLGLQRRNSVAPNQLMQQMFVSDSSMTVGEAAKNSFVEIMDFVMY